MPTVLHVAEATFAGVGRHVLDLVEAQTRRGYEVHVVAGTRRESASFAESRAQLKAVQWHRFDLDRSPGFSDVGMRRRLRNLIDDLRPQIVHGHSTKGGLLARSVPARGAGVVYTPHAAYAMNPLLGARARQIAAGMERALAYRTDAVVAVSPEEATFLNSIGIPASKIHTVPNGIAPISRADADRVRQHLGLPPERPVIGFVGRLEDQKAPEDLVSIFTAVAKRCPSACFAVVGTGSRRSLFIDAAARPPLQGRLHVVGHQVGTWAMSAFDVLVLPSRYEGFPYVVVEAAHLGLPAVVSDRATSSLLETGTATVRAVALGDIDAYVEAIQSVLSAGRASMYGDLDPANPFGYDRRFTVARMAQATTAVYRAATPAAVHGDLSAPSTA
jgi:glycosyltransferase involved in cell wall biosynthesis